jgi:hypothetical protein
MFPESGHRIKTYRRSTRVTAATPRFVIKMLTGCMVLASALWESPPPPPLDVRHFEYYRGGWMPSKRALARAMASAFWWRITVTPKSLENHRKKQEIGLLWYGLGSTISSTDLTLSCSNVHLLLFMPTYFLPPLVISAWPGRVPLCHARQKIWISFELL